MKWFFDERIASTNRRVAFTAIASTLLAFATTAALADNDATTRDPSGTSIVAADDAHVDVETDASMSPDQPGLSMSSLTVGDGRVELEASAQYESDTGSHVWTTPTLLRFGVGDNWELRAATDGYARLNVQNSGSTDGWGDTSLGVKYHVPSSGQQGAPSMGILFTVALPTGTDTFRGKGARPSLAWVTEWSLPDGYGLAVMPGAIYDSGDNGRFLGGFGAVALGRDVTENTHVFAELAAPQIAAASDGGIQLSFNSGVTYRVGKNSQADVAAYAGLNKRTPNLIVTFGFSQRW